MSLNPTDCMERGVIMREMLHALGFYHEQQRADRDNWVHIVQNEIREGICGNITNIKSHISFEDIYIYYNLLKNISWKKKNSRN